MSTSKLAQLQNELHAPKSQYNSFGKYNYRKCEDILEAVKPLLVKHGMTLTISDEMVFVGDRYYIKATCTLLDGEGSGYECYGWAREEEDKKGMDQSQITGAASSYARKYALNGMFLIDDSVDSDQTNNHEKESNQPTASKKQTSPSPKSEIMDKAVNYIKSEAKKQEAYDAIIKKYGNELTENQKSALKKFVR